ncbi:hypothetical protein A9G45_12730 [Gilliamella sp. HK2]|uniref:hypothetical protein n=1 Tax=Gilliamella sp. HK2 TaxID=3120246 RepID=UPI00080D9F78|nr:hypothetical protein [Gilliamella apicola]OCG32083.1 hypothetical protein A9G45_12730 [Gilliamella apicola]
MKVETIRIIEIVPKRHAFKARSYNSAELKNWVDFGSVRKDFSYSFFWQRTSLGEQGAFHLLYTKYPAIAITIINNTIFFINYSPNLILHAFSPSQRMIHRFYLFVAQFPLVGYLQI